jgi:hypothetical protein
MLFYLASAAIAAGRFAVPGSDLSWEGTYEAFAHIWVGVLIAAAFYASPFYGKPRRGLVLWLLGILTVLETVAFLSR